MTVVANKISPSGPGGRKDFEKYVAEALGDLLNNDCPAEEEQPCPFGEPA